MQIETYQNSENIGQSIYTFNGLNRTRRGAVTEFLDMNNMSSKEYPCASSRGKRKAVAELPLNIQCSGAPDDAPEGFTGIAGDKFYYNGAVKSEYTPYFFTSTTYSTILTLPTGCEWDITRIGKRYVMNGYNREKKRSYLYYYDPVADEFGYGGDVLENIVVHYNHIIDEPSGSSDYELIIPSSEILEVMSKGASEEAKESIALTKSLYTPHPSNAGYNVWEKFFSIDDEIRTEGFGKPCYAPSQDVWLEFPTSSPSMNSVDLDNYEGYRISDSSRCHFIVTGFSTMGQGTDHMSRMTISIRNNDNKGIECGEHLSPSGYGDLYTYGVTISKKQPTFTHIGSHHNRLWGTTPTGAKVYASASDDIFDIGNLALSKMYSSFVSSQTASVFTGMSAYNGDMLAFKEDSITVVMGTNAANYTASTLEGVGCIDGRSIVATPGGIIFLSRKGFYIYTGSYPYKISDSLNTIYTSATAGYNGDYYIASAVKEDGTCELLWYDTKRNIWHKEDNLKATGIYTYGAKTYITDDSTLWECDSDEGDTVEWDMTSVVLRNNTLDNKALTEIWILAEVSPNSMFKVWTKADADEWRCHSAFTETGLHLFRCPIKGQPATSYQYKVSGQGKVVIYEIEIVRDATEGRRHKEREGTDTPNRPTSSFIRY